MSDFLTTEQRTRTEYPELFYSRHFIDERGYMPARLDSIGVEEIQGSRVVFTQLTEKTGSFSKAELPPRSPKKQRVVPDNVIESLRNGIDYIKSLGLNLPPIFGVELNYFPGNEARSHAHTAVRHDVVNGVPVSFVNDVSSMCLDLQDADMHTVIHELVHLATPNLCALSGPYHLLLEGFADWVTRGFTKTKFRHQIKPSIPTEFIREECYTSPQATEPGMLSCYEAGYTVWQRIEDQFGASEILKIVFEIEALPAYFTTDQVDEIFAQHTQKTPAQWVESEFTGSIKNFGFLSQQGMDAFIAVDGKTTQTNFSTSLHRIGTFARSFGVLGILQERYPQAYDNVIAQYGTDPIDWPMPYQSSVGRTGFSFGYRTSLPPLCPLTGWDSKGLHFAALSAEAGVMLYSSVKVPDGTPEQNLITLEKARAIPYGKFDVDVVSQGFTLGGGSIVLGLGAAWLLREGEVEPGVRVRFEMVY